MASAAWASCNAGRPCRAPTSLDVARAVCVDATVAMIEKVPATSTVGTGCSDAAAAFMQRRIVGTTQQHETRQRRLAAGGPMLDVMAGVWHGDVTRKHQPTRPRGQPQRPRSSSASRPPEPTIPLATASTRRANIQALCCLSRPHPSRISELLTNNLARS